jgi:phosphoglycolate phosphatase-like HAD superfamily hydrolase
MIGDHPSDALLGIRVGCRTVYLLTGHGKNHADQLEEKGIEPDFIAQDFLEAADYIVENSD